MMRNAALVLLALIASWGTSLAVEPASTPSVDASSPVTGEVLMITADFLVVKESTGKGVQLLFDKNTKLDSTVKIGDRIEAQVSGDGHAKSIRVVKEPTGKQ